MSNNSDPLLTVLLKSGLAINLWADTSTVDEMVSHPKFLKMRDEGNDVFVSLDDVVAFEIRSNRKMPQPQEEDGKKATSEQVGG